MDRLTERVPIGENCSKEFVRLIDGGIRWRYVEGPQTLQQALDRLAAYEDTNRTPAQVAEIAEENADLKIRDKTARYRVYKKRYEDAKAELDEIAEKMRDGRLVEVDMPTLFDFLDDTDGTACAN